MFCCAVLCVLSSLVIILLGKGARLLYSFCLLDVMWLLSFCVSSS